MCNNCVGELEAVIAPDAILASNTSSIRIASIARSLKHRDRVCGMHYFNPVPLMKLVEVIRAADTAQWVVDGMVALGKPLKEIAAELSLSEKTIGTYRLRISQKLGLSTNVELARYAMQHKLVD